MSITTEINRIKTAKQNLMTAINAKGGSLTANSKLEDFVTSVEEDIQTGGSVEIPSGTCFSYSTWSTLPQFVQNYMKTLTGLPQNFMRSCQNFTTELIIPANIKTIGKQAFYECKKMTAVTIPSSVTSIGDSAFEYCSSLTSITIPSSVTSIGKESFSHCDNVTTLVVPDTITTYPNGAFGYNKITSFIIPNTVTQLDGNVFTDCTKLESITIPESVTQIGGYTFNKCTSLTSITIPSSVTLLGNNLFDSCKNIASVTVLATTPPQAQSNMFIRTNSTFVIYVPAESIDAYKAATNWSSLAGHIQAIPTENE